MQKEPYALISAKHNLFDLKLKEVWTYRELIVLFTKRSFKVAYKQTILGPLWLFINPLMTSIFQMILFGGIAKLGTGGVPKILFYLSSNAMWNFFAACFSNNASTFTSNSGLFGKVYFPRLVTPISNVISSMIRFCIQMIMVFILTIVFVLKGLVTPNYAYLILVLVVLIWLGLLGMGLGIIVSSLTTKYRDLLVLVGFGIHLWMYASPIVYPLSIISGNLRTLILLNPVTMPIEIYRFVILGVGTIEWWSVIMSLVMTIAIFLLGLMCFNKVERTFMDTV